MAAAVIAVVGACGASGAGSDDAATGATTTASAVNSDPTTTAPPTTSVTTTTSTTTTTMRPAEPLVYDERGVPENGQTRGVVISPDGWRLPVIGAAGDAWRVWTPCGREADVARGTFVDHVDVVLDPGHGGGETGAVGANGLVERDLNLTVARLAAAELEARGYTVLLTRDTDVRVPLVTRAEIARAVDPIAFISIHHNGGADLPSAVPGTEMFQQNGSPESARLAGLLYEEARAVLDPHDVAWVAMPDAGVLVRLNQWGGDFYGILRQGGDVPSVISEPAYLSNPPEAELLARPDVQAALAKSLAVAFDRYVTTEDPGSGFVAEPRDQDFTSSGGGSTRDCLDPALG